MLLKNRICGLVAEAGHCNDVIDNDRHRLDNDGNLNHHALLA